MQATFSTYTGGQYSRCYLVFRVLLKQYLTCDFKLEIKKIDRRSFKITTLVQFFVFAIENYIAIEI
jgi:hypothetical protein